jgi:peptidoglycan hydrolase-like protein with peptidoglycan-binding domain
MRILRRGSEGEDVRSWQNFLLGQNLLEGGVDGRFGPLTEKATRTFQQRNGLEVDGTVGPLTYAAALQKGFDPGFSDPQGGTSGADWPPPPVFPALVSNAERMEIFGAFRFERVSAGSDDIRILNGWEAENIVPLTLAQLRGVVGAPESGRIRVHKLAAKQFEELFGAWERDGLISLVRSWGGSFVPRYVRGSATNLSNHAWGTAFDIDAEWNPRGALPVLRGRVGSVRELVPRAHELGFYWGGHFSRRDGMHFEIARLLG